MMTAIQQNPPVQNLILVTAKYQLKMQLKAYGLNPNEWRFKRVLISQDVSRACAELFHCNDENLMIKGEAEREPYNMKSIMKWKWSELAWNL